MMLTKVNAVMVPTPGAVINRRTAVSRRAMRIRRRLRTVICLPTACQADNSAAATSSSGPPATSVRTRSTKGCPLPLRLGELGELLGRREVLDRRRQHGVRVGVAIGRAVELRKRQRGAQFEAARFLPLSDNDRGLQRLLGRRGIGRIAL